jgi:hypothetical protein
MVPLRGVIRGGRLKVDVAVDLPDSEVDLDFVRVSDPSELDEASRAKLDASLDRANAQIEAGQGITGAEFFKKLRARR